MIVRGGERGRIVAMALLLAAAMLAVIPVAPSAEAAPPDGPDKLADFEGGVPAGWFTFVGANSVTTPTQVVADADALALPGQAGDNEFLVGDFDVVDFGGFGQEYASTTSPQDWSQTAGFSFWFHGTGSGLTYQAEISDNRSDPNSDTSERFDYEFTDDTAGWRFISIPWADFSRATDFQPGGAPDDGLTLTEVWAWAIVLPQGADVVYFDDFAVDNVTVDDFESGLPSGTDGDGIPIGFHLFNGAGSTVAISTTETPPAPVLPLAAGPSAGNDVLQVDLDVGSFAGVIHSFENDTVDTWVPQDWSASTGFAVWLYGNGSGTSMFFDILENRNADSTADDAERWTVELIHDVAGWRYFEIPFSSLTRKDVGNGAPNDGLDLKQVHGWAFGTLGTDGPQTFYLDDVALYGVAELAELAVQFTSADFEIGEGTTGTVTVALNRALGDEDPAQVSVDYSVETIVAEPGRDFEPVPDGTLTFVAGGLSELTFPITTLDDAKYEPTERLILRLANPVDVELGVVMQASASIIDDDPFDPLLLDDFENDPYFWDALGGTAITQLEIAAGDARELPGQGDYEGVGEITAPQVVEIDVAGNSCNAGNGVVTVAILTTETFDATTVDHTSVRFGDASETHVNKKTGEATRHVEDADGDGDDDLVFHFRSSEIGVDCDSASVLTGSTFAGAGIIAGANPAVTRDFPIDRDWSLSTGLSFWWYGTGSGDEVQVLLHDNRAPDPGPSGWSLAWADEFDDPAGTLPNPANWDYELGDGTVNGIPGWGNSELQSYTNSPENVATDGLGNLVITAAEADGSLGCYYGECEYTSARLVTKNRAEFAYGRIEANVLVPDGEAGLWPAFWSLGTDIDLVAWPQTGEIDIMEYVSRLPHEIFGTIHGPGYSGGNAFGNIYDFGEPTFSDYHEFAIEWQPDLIEWYVDDIFYHTATPADVAPSEWVFNDPVYLLLNMAIGGNFGGSLDEDLTFPQELKVDYVRVYQAPDTAERFEATFVDDVAGWRMVEVPFSAFIRSADQPDGAPNDGLTLTEVWGYGFGLPGGTGTGSVLVDQVRVSAPTQVTVTNTNDTGTGSLRQAVAVVASGGSIDFDPALAGQTIGLSSPIVLSRGVSIDGAAAPSLSLDGGGVDRVLIVDAGTTAGVSNLTMTNGFGFQLAGCVLNNGNLTLDHVTVTGCVMTTDAGDFWQGGGGIYNGGGATLNLIDSTVSDNHAGWSGGGVYSFFDTITVIERSTISGNTTADVGGGIRSLGDATIINSTISGNASIGWYGGAAFITDGAVDLVNVTVAGNVSPGFAPADLFVGTFTDASATLTLTNTIVASAQDGCFAGFFGAGTVTLVSNGHNVATDATCNLTAAGDQPSTDPLLGPLAGNGGPTATHALLAGSPALDAADAAACAATDQRGVARPQGAGCDVGSFELE